MRKDSIVIKTHKGLKRKLILRTLFHIVSLKEAFLLIFAFFRHSTSVSSSKPSLKKTSLLKKKKTAPSCISSCISSLLPSSFIIIYLLTPEQ